MKVDKMNVEYSDHWSDCAVHNAPALPIGECDCGGRTALRPARPGDTWPDAEGRELVVLEKRAIERAIYACRDACLVPPDGGSPTDGEAETAKRAANVVRALLSAAGVSDGSV